MTKCLAQGVSRAPIPFDPEQAAEAVSALPGNLTSGAMGELARGAAGSSPFLARLLKSHGEWFSEASAIPTAEVVGGLVSEAEAAAGGDWEDLRRALRVARARAALFIALCDLGGAWDLRRVTAGISDLADGLTDTALRGALAETARRGQIPDPAEGDAADGPGMFILAMGKMGARELNYSSDIDLICLFDQERFGEAERGDARAAYVKTTRRLVKALSEPTTDGYVFRTDLRLRPSPSTTPICMSTEAAEEYYATVGRTWERAAHIKARPAAGDIEAGRAYLRRLAPFVWRAPLDFAAIDDIEEILRKIRVKKGRFTPSAVPGCDIKLDPGGIREIELFVQTRQLIMAGRLPVLRDPTTLGALAALRDEGVVGADLCGALSEAYVGHRNLEHRLQMIGDNQTQTVPQEEEARARIAALDGWSDRRAWEDAIAERLAATHRVTEGFFDAGSREASAPGGSPLDARSVEALGFGNPGEVRRAVERWRAGGIDATSTEQARRIYSSLEADLLARLGRADHPDAALAEFDRFLSGLPSGARVFAMLKANPLLLERIIDIFTTAPKLARLMGRWPETLDTLLTEDFSGGPPSREWLEADLHIRVGDTGDPERMIEIIKVWTREARFQTAVQVLRGTFDESCAGETFSAVAETVLGALVPIVAGSFAAEHGPPPGRGMALLAMGGLGSRELTAGSGLELAAVYDAGDEERSEGPTPLPASEYFPRLARSLTDALTAETPEGRFHESVESPLHTPGDRWRDAVSLASFEDHQLRGARVREHLALTRGRVVWGDADLADDIGRVAGTALSARREDPSVMVEARAVRAEFIEANHDRRDNHWSLTRAAGGLAEIDHLVRTGGLLLGLGFGRPSRDILEPLAEAGLIDGGDARSLAEALRLQSRLRHIHRVAEDRADVSPEGAKLRLAMAGALGIPDFESLSRTLESARESAASICSRFFGDRR